MRIKMIFNDYEYCRAMANELASIGKGLIAEIGEPWNVSIDRNTLILSDYRPEDLKLHDWRNIIFLTNNPGDELKDEYGDEPIKLFKYKSISSLLSDIEHIYFMFSDNSDTSLGITSRIFTVCSDLSDKSKSLASTLARQIIFRKGGNVAIIPLGYMNKYPCVDESNKSKFAKLMFYMDVGRAYSIDSFVFSDTYGIDYLRLPAGLNPIAYMHPSQVANLITELSSKKYDTIILDVGNCYSELNINMLNRSDNIIYFVDDESSLNIHDVINKSDNEVKLKIIPITHPSESVEIDIDEYLLTLYGINDFEAKNDQENNGKEIC